MFNSWGPHTSAKRTSAPVYSTALVLATNVSAGAMTSSPAPVPTARQARCSAMVAFVTARACLAPVMAAKRSSSSWVTAPIVSQRRSSTSSTACFSASP